jgi:signal transduction histidine kinase
MRRIRELLVEALGTQLADEIELVERVRHVRITAAICLVCSFGFSIFNLVTPGTHLLGFAEIACLLLCFAPAALLIRQPERIESSEALLMLGALAISSSLIVLGGVEGTGLFWVYSVPFLVFFIKGQRRGWYYSLAFLVVHLLCVLVVIPNVSFSYSYSSTVRSHFILSMVFYVLIAAAFNHARSRFEMELHVRKNEAIAASQAKSRFLSAASHDLRQPAHALGLFVARLKQLPGDAQTRELVSGVEVSVVALQDMLNAFFDYSRLDSQLTQASLRNFELNTVFDKLRTSFSETAAQKGLRLRIRPSQDWVYSDPILLQRVLLNLLGNAVQHTPCGTVLLTCRPSKQRGFLRLEVRDSGIGIAEQHQKKVFEEFYQVENPERDRNKGLGLGLSIVERSCKLLNHGLHLRSALGCGSTFTVLVPVGQSEESTVATTIPEGIKLQDIRGMRVLLIEDDELGRAALKGLLQSWGCLVVEASSADAALQCWDSRSVPDFILTDYRLLGAQNGVDAVRNLRQAAARDVPACVISGDTAEEVKTLISLAGLTLLQKPVKPAKLRSVLRHARNQPTT